MKILQNKINNHRAKLSRRRKRRLPKSAFALCVQETANDEGIDRYQKLKYFFAVFAELKGAAVHEIRTAAAKRFEREQRSYERKFEKLQEEPQYQRDLKQQKIEDLYKSATDLTVRRRNLLCIKL